jgi:lipopolysaccharide biosynthesis glycosyltransferase
LEKIRVFIGSGEASAIERKVLIYSIKKNTPSAVEVNVFNGTHDTLEKNDEAPVRINMSLRAKYLNFTEFSNYRFLIPALCNFTGRAIFIDSDTICLADIGKLFHMDMEGNDLVAKGNAYGQSEDKRWGLSVMLIDCAKARFDLEKYLDDVEEKKYTYTDFHQLSPKFQKFHPFKIGELSPQWNDFDHYDANTKVIHYTNLYSQPWKSPGHKYGDLWFTYFREARANGFLTDDDINRAVTRSYVRRDLANATNSGLKYYSIELLRAMKNSLRTLRK